MKRAALMIVAIIGVGIGMTFVSHYWWEPDVTTPSFADQKSVRTVRTFRAPKPSASMLPDRYPQISLKHENREDGVKEAANRYLSDRYAPWKTAMSFYGKAVDESGRGIPGVQVKFQWTDLSAKGTAEEAVVTGSDGMFRLERKSGKRLIVHLKTKDYYVNPLQERSFEFFNPGEDIYYEPDPEHPNTFVLKKKGVGVLLAHREISVSVPNDGTPVNVDLNRGVAAQEGQMILRAWKPDRQEFPYDWEVSFEIKDGGFVEHDDVYPFEAPSFGYTAGVEIKKRATGGNLSSSFDKKYYFCFGAKRVYGRIRVRTYGNANGWALDYDYNPDGSTNLEEQSSRE